VITPTLFVLHRACGHPAASARSLAARCVGANGRQAGILHHLLTRKGKPL